MTPITHSSGQTFVLAVECEATIVNESVSPWAFNGKHFPLLDLYHGGRRQDRLSLCFRTVSSPRC